MKVKDMMEYYEHIGHLFFFILICVIFTAGGKKYLVFNEKNKIRKKGSYKNVFVYAIMVWCGISSKKM